jgi:deoxyribodipyrimidine photo-lyase
MNFPIATRSAGLNHLATFVPQAGRMYAQTRNFDTSAHPRINVSSLSPYIRHRLLTEQEVVSAILARHTLSAAEKFVQEVCWRTYWKGWLELHPVVWQRFLDGLRQHKQELSKDDTLTSRLSAAESGATGIECFDAWVGELVETGYLHNHARMWFASIWVFTLELPWELGADFFMRHLLDGDPASNTLSWRWVCGLQTVGKTYLARADNIARYTDGRFNPQNQLATVAAPITEKFTIGKSVFLSPGDAPPVPWPTALILTEEDLHSESWGVGPGTVACVIGLRTAHAYPDVSAKVIAFKQAALADGIARAQAYFSCPAVVLPAERDGISQIISDTAVKMGAQSLTQHHLPVGPTAKLVSPVISDLKLQGWSLRSLRRDWDNLFWPHATHGFFKLREQIPRVLAELAVEDAPQLPF